MIIYFFEFKLMILYITQIHMVHVLTLGTKKFGAIFLRKCEINFGIATTPRFFVGIYDFWGNFWLRCL
jgi:hypothetical protein